MLLWLSGLLPLGACALLPAELNLSPLYRHRLDLDGSLLELDVLWPIVHYERRPDGGDDFRIRPLYRRVTDGEPGGAVEHQFLWPFGRVRSKGDETLSRVFPFFYKQSRTNQDGKRETDWYFLFPFVWGGSSEDGKEDYLAVLPFYADIPQFLTYDRFQSHLFPLHVRTEKSGKVSHVWLWPLIGSGGNESGTERWHRFLPFYSVAIDEARYERYSALWPFVHFGVEDLDRNPFSTFFLWPLYGRQSGATVDSWTFLWPFFQKTEIKGRYYKVDVLWPIFRTVEDKSPSSPLRQWSIFPLVTKTTTNDQRSAVYFWPLVWIGEYDDPEGLLTREFVIPFAWHTHRLRPDGTDDDFLKLWPLMHRRYSHDGTSETQLFSPLPWRESNIEGVDEAYGWLWTLARARQHARGDSSFELTANLATTRTRQGRTTASVPFLFNFEEDANGSTLRLFQFLPLRWTRKPGADDR